MEEGGGRGGGRGEGARGRGVGSEGEGDLKGNPLQQVCQIENSKDSDVKCHKEFNFKLNFEWKENGNLILESLSLSLCLAIELNSFHAAAAGNRFGVRVHNNQI